MESCIWLGVCYGKRVSDVSDEVSVRDPCTSWGQPFFDVRLSRVSDDVLWVLYRGTVMCGHHHHSMRDHSVCAKTYRAPNSVCTGIPKRVPAFGLVCEIHGRHASVDLRRTIQRIRSPLQKCWHSHGNSGSRNYGHWSCSQQSSSRCNGTIVYTDFRRDHTCERVEVLASPLSCAVACVASNRFTLGARASVSASRARRPCWSFAWLPPLRARGVLVGPSLGCAAALGGTYSVSLSAVSR